MRSARRPDAVRQHRPARPVEPALRPRRPRRDLLPGTTRGPRRQRRPLRRGRRDSGSRRGHPHAAHRSDASAADTAGDRPRRALRTALERRDRRRRRPDERVVGRTGHGRHLHRRSGRLRRRRLVGRAAPLGVRHRHRGTLRRKSGRHPALICAARARRPRRAYRPVRLPADVHIARRSRLLGRRMHGLGEARRRPPGGDRLTAAGRRRTLPRRRRLRARHARPRHRPGANRDQRCRPGVDHRRPTERGGGRLRHLRRRRGA